MVRSPPSSRRGEHGRPTEGAGRPRQRALPARRLFARGRASRAGGGAGRGLRRRASHAGRHLPSPRGIRRRPARAGEGPGHQSQLCRGGSQPRRAARARLRSSARGAGHGALRRREARGGHHPVARGAADGPAAPDRRPLSQARAPEVGVVSERSWALRFISGKYQGGEYPLADSGELIIGRSSELDLVLIEDMVSRKHARLTLAAGGITIADLGSTNGTFVNGEKVRRAQLKEGDRILIGTSILKLVARTAGATVNSRAAQQKLERTAAAHEKKQGTRTTVQGRLEEVPLVDLLQLLSTSKKTGAIVIKGYRS